MFNRPDNDDRARVFAACLLALVVLVVMPPAQARAVIADSWTWPLTPPWDIVTAYEAPPTPYGAGHRGIDLASSLGAPVFAPASGVILFAGIVVDRGVISIDHGGGITSSFEPVTANVTAGDSVQTGDVIGQVSGVHARSACECLHLGARINDEYVSPLAFLSAIARAVLLPWRD